MKKILTALLFAVILCTAAACSPENQSDTLSGTEATTAAASVTDEVKEQMDNVLEGRKFKGIVSLTKNGEVVYQYVNGKDKDENDLTIGSSMYIGSTSKQFCAASIIMLRDKGKLSVDDTLDKYFPEYEEGKKLTIKNLLTMRSGILDMVNEAQLEEVNYENTAEENMDIVRKWIFSQPLKFEPDSEYAYSNSNFFLLSEIVKQVSGMSYHDFVRENIFEPLGMSHSGFIEDVTDDPVWADGLKREEGNNPINPQGLPTGAGDIASNAADMDLWMAGLSDGTIVSEESYKEMIKDYSPESSTRYGYGLMGMAYDGIGHVGSIGTYNALDYINKDHGFRLFIASNKASSQSYIESLPTVLLKDLIEEKGDIE